MGKRASQYNQKKQVTQGQAENANDSGTVLILHDDDILVDRLVRMFRTAKLEHRLFLKAAQLLENSFPSGPVCLVTSASDGEQCGLRVYEDLKAKGIYIPAVFLARTTDFRLAVRAMRAGAEDFVSLPFDEIELLASVIKALDRSRRFVKNCALDLELRRRAALLTDREREIVRLVIAGLLNKEIADHLRLALVTVKVHRGNAMRKLGARTGAELARIARSVGIWSGAVEPASRKNGNSPDAHDGDVARA